MLVDYYGRNILQNNNDLNIRLLDVSKPETTHEILGDFLPQDFDPRPDAPVLLGTGTSYLNGVYNVWNEGPRLYSYYQILNPGNAGQSIPYGLAYTDQAGQSRFVYTPWSFFTLTGFTPNLLLYPDASAGIRYEFDPYTLGAVPVDPYVTQSNWQNFYASRPGNLVIDPTRPIPPQTTQYDNLVGGEEADHMVGGFGNDINDWLQGGGCCIYARPLPLTFERKIESAYRLAS